MFTRPDEFNYIFSEEITAGVAQPARGQHYLWILKLLAPNTLHSLLPAAFRTALSDPT